MRNACLFALAAVAACAAPGVARAALTLTVEDVTVQESTSDISGFFEVFFTETEPAADERLASFSLRLDLTPGSSTGVRFVPPPLKPSDHPFVFPAATTLTDFMSDFDTIQVAADVASGAEVDIDDGEGVVRVPFLIPANTAPGTFLVTIDPGSEFTGADGLPIAFARKDGTITVTAVPEPAALSLLAGVGLLALRRSRRA